MENKGTTIKEMLAKAIIDENYHSFEDGAPISDSEKNNWIEKCASHILRLIEENPTQETFHQAISSGNLKVFVEAYRNDDNTFCFFFNVTKAYKSFHLHDVVI